MYFLHFNRFCDKIPLFEGIYYNKEGLRDFQRKIIGKTNSSVDTVKNF